MTFQVNRRQPLSGSNGWLVVCVITLSVSQSFGAPVLQKTSVGTIDWTSGLIRVVGVGTPRLLSATAGVTEGSLTRLAKADGQKRLKTILDNFCPVVRNGEKTRVGGCLKSAELGIPSTPLRMSDGSIHQVFTLPFDTIFGADNQSVNPKDITQPTALLVRMRNEAVKPTSAVIFVADTDSPIVAGGKHGAIGRRGIRWVHKPISNSVLSSLGPRILAVDGRLVRESQNSSRPTIKLNIGTTRLASLPSFIPVLITVPGGIDEN